MAIVSMQNIKNRLSDSGGDSKNDYEWGVNDNPRRSLEANLYRTDHSTALAPNVADISPVRENLSLEHEDHVYPYINRFKDLEIAVTGILDDGLMADDVNRKKWGNWRTMNLAKVQVHPNVRLITEDSVFQFQYTNDMSPSWEAIDSKGILGKITSLKEMGVGIMMLAGQSDKAASAGAGGRAISRYKKTPAWGGTSPIELNTSLKFKFQFGQYGIFSGEHEVVRPILALASLFAPIRAGAYMYGIAPTVPAFIFEYMYRLPGVIKNTFENIQNTMSNAGSGLGNKAAGVVQSLSDIESGLVRINEEAIRGALNRYGSRGLMIRKGRFTAGPVVVKNVSWEFDFNHVDEFGFPYAGSCTFGGLEGSTLASPWEIVKTFRRVGTVGEDNTEEGNNNTEKDYALVKDQKDLKIPTFNTNYDKDKDIQSNHPGDATQDREI